jgi:Uma2 family endonuclease
MASTEHITTAEQLFQTPGLGRSELVRGELIMMAPAGYRHGRLVSRINSRLEVFVEQAGLGEVTGAETGFLIARNPDTVRAPDVAFLTRDRVPATPPVGFYDGAPDLVVEILSPSDRASEVLGKVYDWLDAGCRAVWVVEPETKTVTVYRSRSQIVVLGVADQLSGEDVVPGFNLSVAEVFA